MLLYGELNVIVLYIHWLCLVYLVLQSGIFSGIVGYIKYYVSAILYYSLAYKVLVCGNLVLLCDIFSITV